MDISYLNQVVVSATSATTIFYDSKEIQLRTFGEQNVEQGLLPIAYLPSLTSPTAPYSPSDTFPPFFAFYSLTSFSSVFSEYCVEVYGLTTDEEIEYVYGEYYKVIKNEILRPCLVTDVSGTTGTCNYTAGTYTLDVIVTYSDPGSQWLKVNGQVFSADTSPQTVTIVWEIALGTPVQIGAWFTEYPFNSDIVPYCEFNTTSPLPC